MRQTAARLWPGALSPAWLLPLAALFIWSIGGRGHPLGGPTALAAATTATPVAIGAVAWLLMLRRDRARWLAVAAVAGIALAAVFVVDPATVFEDSWDRQLRVELAVIAGLVAVLGAWLGRRRAGPPRPLDVLIGLVVVGMVIVDIAVVDTAYQRDLNLYLDAGHDFVSGLVVYAPDPLQVVPTDQTELPFVYPPVALPFFGALSLLPQPLVAATWLALQCAAAVLAIRAMGVPWRWTPLLFLWPPFVQGIWVGNVAIWMVMLFALVPVRPFLVSLPPVFKFQTALAGLWLLRERRWRSLVASIVLVGGLVVATLPLVGVDRWVDWYHGLLAFQQSTVNFPAIRSLAISRSVGEMAALGLAAAMVAISFRVRRGSSLADLGLASVTVSPTLYLHGLTLALAGLLQLRAAAFWLALLVAVMSGYHDFLGVVLVIGALASVVPLLRHDPGSAEAVWQPLGARAGPWSNAPGGGLGAAIAGHDEPALGPGHVGATANGSTKPAKSGSLRGS
jgi:hypothetical protein